MNVINDILKTGRDLIINETFYGLFLSTLNKKLSNDLPTAGVAKNGLNVQLLVNPEFWEKDLNVNTRYGVLKHELLHICLDHLELRHKYEDKILFNIAAD